MGVEYSGQIIVGLPRSAITNQDLIHDDELEVCSPHYDGAGEPYAIAGFRYLDSGDYSNTELVWDANKIEQLKQKFHKLTGQDAKVYLSTHGW